MGSIGEKFTGRAYDAVWDARNTASIYKFSKDTAAFDTVMKPVMELLKP